MSSGPKFVATLICVGVASCSALASVLVWRIIESSALHTERKQTEKPRRRAGQRSSWAWLARWPLSQLARPLVAHIPAGLRAAIGRMLERADLDEILDAGQWLMAPLLAASAMALGCCLLSGARGMSLALQAIAAAGFGAAVPYLALRERIVTRQRQVLRELPGYLDLLALALEAGCAFSAALQLAVQRSPPSPLRSGLERVLREMRAGSPRGEALRRFERRVNVPALAAAVAAIVQAEATGVSLVPVIRAQSMRGTQERFARAEKLAMEAPVKMLAPLVLCIFPCTFIVIGFPIAVRLLWGL
jgi:tight adherence protein C